MRLLIPSAGPLVTFSSTAFKIPHRCFLIILATFLMGSNRLLTAQESQRFQPFFAQALLT
uniref:Uncharacterized protein n=1 Tax=Candidatus Kentrum sp. LPFa TaxID=2126335 RepID=A0A450W3P8_9GAMM|nr:MAG: hypothetical protein BECKLPF1236A_GA0070988_1005916 [Candidatus Kentron sp. LPFa]VFK27187.1 MAG: hypothetical protein BECKLPF1236A_GA0070988_105692 [Candidatus Kentron sp. LPFa]VFK36283.1 MAG: hypothetical protein BECKLPF1236C_GA0070990_105662 [Candidatus Kentron sp. LPFa]